MGACKSKIDGGSSSSLSINEAAISNLDIKIRRKLQKQTNRSEQFVKSRQDIEIKEKGGGGSDAYYNKTMSVEKGPFGIFGRGKDCPVFGCNYDITQTSNFNIISFNQNVVEETENIWRDISTDLKQQASTQLSSSAVNAANRAIDSAMDLVKENIRTKLTNLSQTVHDGDQKILIEYETPPRCKDPCGLTEEGTEGPKLNQFANVQIHSADILNSSLKIIETKLAEHKVDVTQDISDENDACILQLIISGVVCFVCLLIVWKLVKMMTQRKPAQQLASMAQ